MVEDGGDFIKNMFNDLEQDSRVEVFKQYFNTTPEKNRKYSNLSSSNGIVSRSRRKIYNYFYSFLKNIVIKDELTFFILPNPSALGIDAHYLERFLKKNRNVVPVMIFIDPIGKPMSNRAKDLVDKVSNFICITFDKDDAERYGWEHFACMYSVVAEPNNYVLNNDIYFIGYKNDKLDMLHKIGCYIKTADCNASINILGVDKREQKNIKGVNYSTQYKPYKEVLEDVQKTNCILEIRQKGQSGPTLRYYEAIVYNKKLLTNNKDIVNMPFYDARYMKYFEKIEDIDTEWVKKQENIDYGYDGRYSPVYILDIIENAYKKRQGLITCQ